MVDLLTTPLAEHAGELARYLDGQNQKRQQLERRILAEAREMLDGQELERLSAIVLASPDWHPGVIGIVAGRLVETYARPVMLFGQVRSKEHLFAMEGISEATAQRVDDEVRELVMRGYETARQIVGKNRASVRAMAEELLSVESLDSDGIKAIIAANMN